MEGYDNSNTSCKQAVLNFLSGWTQGLHAASYLSGVYSSAASGIADLASQYGTSYSSPDDIWIADWTGDPVLTDPYVPNADWASHQRLHQYYGGHAETRGGAGVNSDARGAGGPEAAAGQAGRALRGRPVQQDHGTADRRRARAARRRRDRHLQHRLDRPDRRQGPAAGGGAGGAQRAVLQPLRLVQPGGYRRGLHPILLHRRAAAAAARREPLRELVRQQHRGHEPADRGSGALRAGPHAAPRRNAAAPAAPAPGSPPGPPPR